MSGDPYTDVYNALWAALEASPEFCAAVAEANRIKYSGENPTPRKSAKQDSDFPEVTILPGTSQMGVMTSTSEGSNQSFIIQVATGDWRLQRVLHPMKLIIVRAIRAAGPSLGLKGLVNGVVIGDQVPLDASKEEAGKAGWVLQMAITARMQFSRTAGLQPGV